MKVFLYFMNAYHDEINGGGTFTLAELFEEFKREETDEKISQLFSEAKQIGDQLRLEDWEMDPEILGLCNRYKKRHMKRMVQMILDNRSSI